MKVKASSVSASTGGLLLLAFMLIGLSSCISELKPEPPVVSQSSIFIGIVKRSSLTVQTGGGGRLRPSGHGRFKAVLLLPEVAESDLELGQTVALEVKDNLVTGKVVKIQDSANGTVPVEVSLSGALPKQARDGLPVSGTIELGRLDDVLTVGRPAFGQTGSTVGMFKLDAKGEMATRVPVKLGKGSLQDIQILDGLHVGDRVIISDMSRYDNVDAITLSR